MTDLMTLTPAERAMSSATGPTAGIALRGEITKVEADYTDHASNPAERCSACKHFIASSKRCQIVEGAISPDGWCKHFEPSAQKSQDHAEDAMVAFMIEPALAEYFLVLAREAGILLTVDKLHLTLAYLGETTALESGPASDEENVAGEIANFARRWSEIEGSVNGIIRFVDAPDKDAVCLSFDSPDLPEFRAALMDWLHSAGINPVETHGFTPHITLAYIDKDAPMPQINLDPVMVAFREITLMWGNHPNNLPLADTAAEIRSEKGTQTVTSFKIVKHNGKYQVLNLSSGERTPEAGYDTREEATKHLHALDASKDDDGGDDSGGDDAAMSAGGSGGGGGGAMSVEAEAIRKDDDSATEDGGNSSENSDAAMSADVEAIRKDDDSATEDGGESSDNSDAAMSAPEDAASDDDEGKTEGMKSRHGRGSEDFNAYFYGEMPAAAMETADKDADPDTFGYVPDKEHTSTWKLPMPDARHVLLAAAAMGPNPPHGNRADIPESEHAKVRSKIRSRAQALGLSKDDMAKVNAYLSGKMPGDLSEKDFSQWAKVYAEALAETGDDTKAALAAQGACNRRAMLGSKSVNGLPTSVEGWMVLFSDPDNLDLQDTYFDQTTRLLTDYYPNAPLWMEHGKNPDYGADPIGHRTAIKVYRRGVWGEHALHTDHPLYPRTAKDAARGKFAYSSDSLAHYAQQGFDPTDGHLGEWPLAGCSLTRTPAEPGLGPVLAAKSLELALKSAAQQREAAGVSDEPAQKSTRKETIIMPGENTDINDEDDFDTEDEVEEVTTIVAAKDSLEEVDDNNDDFDTDDQDTAPESTLDALARMYGCDPEPTAVRGAMDNHIAKIQTEGQAHPDLIKALGMPDDSKAEDVASHLNNLYSAAMTSKDAVPSSTMAAPAEYNYKVLHNHLSSGGAKSVGPYMTGDIARKGINHNSGISKVPLMGAYTDLIRRARGERSTLVLGQKAMSSASGPNGGYILHQEISPVVLDPLRAKVVCYQLGAEHINMQGTNVMTVPIMNSAPDASWVGENQAVTDSQPGYRTVTLYPHGLSSLVKVPFNVEANMTPQAEQQLRKQMAKSIALKIDKACLLGTGGALVSGGGMEIVGILNTPSTQTYDLGSNGRIPQFTDIGQAFGLLDDQNVPYDDESKRGIALHSQISRAFTLATDTLGNPLLRPAWRAAAEREIMAMPYAISNQIPTNITEGSSTNSSYIFGGDWQYMYIGLSDQVEVRLDQTFAGNLQAGLLIYVYADVKIVYPQAFFTMKGVLPVSISGVTTGTVS